MPRSPKQKPPSSTNVVGRQLKPDKPTGQKTSCLIPLYSAPLLSDICQMALHADFTASFNLVTRSALHTVHNTIIYKTKTIHFLSLSISMQNRLGTHHLYSTCLSKGPSTKYKVILKNTVKNIFQTHKCLKIIIMMIISVYIFAVLFLISI